MMSDRRDAAPTARYRVVAPAFAHAYRARFAQVSQTQAARSLGVSIPTLRRLLAGDGTINSATVARLERALRLPRMNFVTTAAVVTPLIPALTSLPATRVDATLQAFATNPMLAGFFAQFGRHVHWSANIVDPRRPYRQPLRRSHRRPGGGYVVVVVEPAALPLDLAVSFVVRGGGLDVAIDYGLIQVDSTSRQSWSIICREHVVARGGTGPLEFLTWLRDADDEVIVRSSHPCTVRATQIVGRLEGERRFTAATPTIGFRAMGLFHLPATPPWAEVEAPDVTDTPSTPAT